MTANNTSFSNGKFSLRNEMDKYLKHWPWFVFWLVLAILIGFFYLKYATPIYSASATIVINEEKGDGGSSEMAAYSNLGFLDGLNSSSIDRELTILKSRRIMKEVVRALNLNLTYFKEGSLKEEELYNNLPFTLKVLKMDEEKLTGSHKYKIIQTSSNNFKITNLKTTSSITVTSGNPFDLGYANLVITSKPNAKRYSEIIMKISEIEKAASKYRGKIQVLPIKDNSNVINLVLDDPIKEKAKDIIDQLIFEFNKDAIEDKNLIAGNTANFINERLAIINNELESVESGKEEFKESNRLTDLGAESQLNIRNASEYNQRLQEIGTQIELTNSMQDYLGSASKEDLLPANLGIRESGVNQQIGEYNNLVLERNRILGSSTEKNPVVVRLSNRIDQIKSNVMQSLQSLETTLQISQDDISRQASSIGSRILAVPSQERQYRGIERQQNIKEALYLFLLQKREENSLALAITAPKAKVVDRAYSGGGVISPNSTSIILGSALLGLFIPFSFVYIKEVLDNKIRSRKDVEALTQEIPFMGEIPRIRKKHGLLVAKNDRSVLAESFRILVTNLQYLMVNVEKREKAVSIFVTSSIKGEGKTFTSINLALTLANSGHKTLLVGADLRNPKLQKFKSQKDQKLGISDYLVSDSLEIEKLIEPSNVNPDLHILSSGSIPPNPSELLGHSKIGEMLNELKNSYDYLIVDTAPSMLVADTFFISKYADLTLFVIKAGHTENQLIEFAVNSKRSAAIHNVGFVLNNVDISNLGYGNKYGYGYGSDKMGFWNRN